MTGSTSPSSAGLAVHATCRRPGSRAAAAAKGSGGGGAQEPSPTSRPASTSSAAAVSATVRLSTPSTARKLSLASGRGEIRWRWGLRPTRPQHAAGMRVEPPPSVAWAIGTIPAATAAPEPPDDPPDVRARSHGLRVAPNRFVFVHGWIAHSGSVVEPDEDEARGAQARDDVVIVGRDPVPEEAGAAGHPPPGHGAAVLDRDRDAGERPRVTGADGLRGRERLVGVDVDERVDLRVKLLDAAQRGLDELGRADLARVHERGELERGTREQVGAGGHPPRTLERSGRWRVTV